MNDIRPDQKKDVICYCSGTTKRKIRELIDNGINDLDRISRRTGACSGCGACDTLILELIAEYR
ncbi:MAG: (2Fe-2S)-binding protein [Methylobacter sp.]|jgi:bacterioferritin-associated ferredoxin